MIEEERGNRLETDSIGTLAYPKSMRVTRSLDIPESELDFRFSRASGPGGQNVNKRATKVEVTFDVAGSPSLTEAQRTKLLRLIAKRLDGDGRLHVVSQDARTQHTNREHAVEKLRAILARALAPPPKKRVATKPSRAAKDRRIQEKLGRSRTKGLRAKPAADE